MCRPLWKLNPIAPVLLSLALASTASAVPLVYGVVPAESSVTSQQVIVASADVTPDPTEIPVLNPDGDFPVNLVPIATSSTTPSGSSSLTADVGLPSDFDDGANGIVISDFTVDVPQAGTIITFAAFTVPLGIPGVPGLFVAGGSLGNYSITLDSPITSALTPGLEANEWLWSTPAASITISGTVNPRIEIPTVQVIEPAPVPFTQALTVPLAGTFSGDGTSTEVTLGIPLGELDDAFTVPLPPVQEQIVLLDALGIPLATVSISFSQLIVQDLTTSVVYRNANPIPEPGTAALLGLGLLALALQRKLLGPVGRSRSIGPSRLRAARTASPCRVVVQAL